MTEDDTEFPAGKRPGMTDVARMAGVSVQTVSRVLNHHPNVSAKTHRRVADAIKLLGYHRNTAAMTLVTRSSRILGVVNFGMTHVGPYETLRAVQEAAQDADYFVSLANVRNLSAASIHKAFDSLLSQAVDGIVVIAPHYEALTIIDEIPARVPIAVIGPRGRFEFASINVDQARGAQLAAEHLLELGHTRLVHIAGPLDWLDAKARLESWHRRLRAAGVEEFPSAVGDWDAASGFERAKEVMGDYAPTAIFVSSDQMALGVLHALHRSGHRVPEDVSVVGFGNIAGTAFYEPALTTIAIDFDEVGRQSMALMFDLMHGMPREPIILEPKLVVRDSSGPPPA